MIGPSYIKGFPSMLSLIELALDLTTRELLKFLAKAGEIESQSLIEDEVQNTTSTTISSSFNTLDEMLSHLVKSNDWFSRVDKGVHIFLSNISRNMSDELSFPIVLDFVSLLSNISLSIPWFLFSTYEFDLIYVLSLSCEPDLEFPLFDIIKNRLYDDPKTTRQVYEILKNIATISSKSRRISDWILRSEFIECVIQSFTWGCVHFKRQVEDNVVRYSNNISSYKDYLSGRHQEFIYYNLYFQSVVEILAVSKAAPQVLSAITIKLYKALEQFWDIETFPDILLMMKVVHNMLLFCPHLNDCINHIMSKLKTKIWILLTNEESTIQALMLEFANEFLIHPKVDYFDLNHRLLVYRTPMAARNSEEENKTCYDNFRSLAYKIYSEFKLSVDGASDFKFDFTLLRRFSRDNNPRFLNVNLSLNKDSVFVELLRIRLKKFFSTSPKVNYILSYLIMTIQNCSAQHLAKFFEADGYLFESYNESFEDVRILIFFDQNTSTNNSINMFLIEMNQARAMMTLRTSRSFRLLSFGFSQLFSVKRMLIVSEKCITPQNDHSTISLDNKSN